MEIVITRLSKMKPQVTSPVQWETTVKTLLGKGLKKSYELGPGKVLNHSVDWFKPCQFNR